MLTCQRLVPNTTRATLSYEQNMLTLQCGIESVKTAADVYAPTGCEVIATNEKVGKDASLVNTSAEGEGWLLKVKVENEADLSKHSKCINVLQTT